MKVLYDHQCFVNDRHSGISKYFYKSIQHLSCDNNFDIELSLKYSNNIYLPHLNNFQYKTFFPKINIKGQRKLLRIIDRNYSKHRLEKRDYDIFHPTYYDTYFFKYIGNKKYIITIYDMISEIFSDDNSKQNALFKSKKILAQNALKIITISKQTKLDVMNILGINENKIKVIHLGVEILDNSNKNIKINLPDNFVFYLGKRRLYKNFNFLISSIKDILIDTPDFYLVCAGGGKFDKHEVKIIEKLGLSNKIINLNTLSEEELYQVYQKAMFFVFPSLYEGFGIPILEAFINKCPLLISNIDVFSEIAGKAAHYFNPQDENSIRVEFEKLMNNTHLRKHLINKGSERVKEFSWQKSTEMLKHVYLSAINRS
jgi:glycosyltransferase involved in cell wall biosynthesis